ncbi:MAG: hypothetical protein M1819_007005 [Sarea resinae]|nr:MAG: hypothetical protein M1819_007005 [Sarea resinae]
MKILETQSATLTNYEVLTHIQLMRSRRQRPSTRNPTAEQKQQQQQQQHQPSKAQELKSPNLETILKELSEYLLSPPSPLCASTPNAPAGQQEEGEEEQEEEKTPAITASTEINGRYSAEAIRTLLTQLKPYHLTKPETLMILNLRPTNSGVLDTVVEEMEMRFPDSADVDGIIGTIVEVLGGVEGEVGEEEDEDLVDVDGDGVAEGRS